MKLKEIREHLNYNQKEFAQFLGKHPVEINRFEKQNKEITINLLKSLINKLPNLNLNWLVKGEGEMFLDGGKISDINPDDIRTSQGDMFLGAKQKREDQAKGVKTGLCETCGQLYGIETVLEEKDKRLEEKDKRLEEKDTLLIMQKKEITRLEKEAERNEQLHAREIAVLNRELTQKNQSLERTAQVDKKRA